MKCRMHRGQERIHLFTLGVLIATSLLVVGCASGPSSAEVPAEGHRIGDTVSLDGALITARFVLFSKGDYASYAEAGKTWVVVTVRVENNGDESLEIDPADFSILSSEGELAPSKEGERVFFLLLEKTSLEPGSRVEGRIIFYAPEGELLRLRWKPGWSDQDVVINLVE